MRIIELKYNERYYTIEVKYLEEFDRTIYFIDHGDNVQVYYIWGDENDQTIIEFAKLNIKD